MLCCCVQPRYLRRRRHDDATPIRYATFSFTLTAANMPRLPPPLLSFSASRYAFLYAEMLMPLMTPLIDATLRWRC